MIKYFIFSYSFGTTLFKNRHFSALLKWIQVVFFSIIFIFSSEMSKRNKKRVETTLNVHHDASFAKNLAINRDNKNGHDAAKEISIPKTITTDPFSEIIKTDPFGKTEQKCKKKNTWLTVRYRKFIFCNIYWMRHSDNEKKNFLWLCKFWVEKLFHLALPSPISLNFHSFYLYETWCASAYLNVVVIMVVFFCWSFQISNDKQKIRVNGFIHCDGIQICTWLFEGKHMTVDNSNLFDWWWWWKSWMLKDKTRVFFC